MRLTYRELQAINTALAELLAGEGPQGYLEEDGPFSKAEGERLMGAARNAQDKICKEFARREEKRRAQ